MYANIKNKKCQESEGWFLRDFCQIPPKYHPNTTSNTTQKKPRNYEKKELSGLPKIAVRTSPTAIFYFYSTHLITYKRWYLRLKLKKNFLNNTRYREIEQYTRTPTPRLNDTCTRATATA